MLVQNQTLSDAAWKFLIINISYTTNLAQDIVSGELELGGHVRRT